jgi:hypothetical protein
MCLRIASISRIYLLVHARSRQRAIHLTLDDTVGAGEMVVGERRDGAPQDVEDTEDEAQDGIVTQRLDPVAPPRHAGYPHQFPVEDSGLPIVRRLARLH